MSGFLRSMGRSYLSNSIRDQENREQDQEMAYRSMHMQAMQSQLEQEARQRQAAAIAAQIIPGAAAGRLPQNVAIPGATQMPGASGGGGYLPQPGGGGFGGSLPPPQSSQTYQPPPSNVVPGSAPIRDEGARMQTPQPAPSMGAQPPRPVAKGKTTAPQMGQNGITLDQLSAHIDQQYPGIDPQAKYEVIKQYRDYLTTQHKQELEDFEATLKGRSADTADTNATLSQTREARVGKQEGTRLGLEERRVAAEEAKAKAPAKQTDAQRSYAVAKDDIAASSAEIKRIIAEQPLALGAYGKIYKGIGGIGGLMGEPTPQAAEAAYKLNVEFENLLESLGVAGSVGRMGATTFTKRWEKALGDKDILNNASRMNTQLDQLVKRLDRQKPVEDAPAQSQNQGWSIAPIGE